MLLTELAAAAGWLVEEAMTREKLRIDAHAHSWQVLFNWYVG
jgi:hypothetical protein